MLTSWSYSYGKVGPYKNLVPVVAGDMRSVTDDKVTEICQESPQGETNTVGPGHQVPSQLGASFPLFDQAGSQDDGQRPEHSIGEAQGGCE